MRTGRKGHAGVSGEWRNAEVYERRHAVWEQSNARRLLDETCDGLRCNLRGFSIDAMQAGWIFDAEGRDVVVLKWDRLSPETAQYPITEEQTLRVSILVGLYHDALRTAGIPVKVRRAKEVDDTAWLLSIDQRAVGKATPMKGAGRE